MAKLEQIIISGKIRTIIRIPAQMKIKQHKIIVAIICLILMVLLSKMKLVNWETNQLSAILIIIPPLALTINPI